MILCMRNAICLALVMIGACACGMVREESATASSKQNWFEYAYYSSPAIDETTEGGALKASRMKLQ